MALEANELFHLSSLLGLHRTETEEEVEMTQRVLSEAISRLEDSHPRYLFYPDGGQVRFVVLKAPGVRVAISESRDRSFGVVSESFDSEQFQPGLHEVAVTYMLEDEIAQQRRGFIEKILPKNKKYCEGRLTFTSGEKGVYHELWTSIRSSMITWTRQGVTIGKLMGMYGERKPTSADVLQRVLHGLGGQSRVDKRATRLTVFHEMLFKDAQKTPIRPLLGTL